MKQLFLLLFLSFCALTLFACQSQSEEMKLLGNISEISISNSNGYDGLNENYFVFINQTEAILGFEEVLKNARGKNQDVDVINGKPDYDILIRYENGDTNGLHFILGNTGAESIVMNIGHENIGYFISPEETNKIRKLLNVQK